MFSWCWVQRSSHAICFVTLPPRHRVTIGINHGHDRRHLEPSITTTTAATLMHPNVSGRFFFPFFKFYFTNPDQCLHIDCAYGHRVLHLLIPPPSSSLHQNGLTPRCGLVDPILLVVTDAERIWWSEYVLCICQCAAHSSYWLDYFWRNLINSVVQMSKGVKRIILFDRKLFFLCLLSKYMVSIFDDRSELGNIIYREIFRFVITNLKRGIYEPPPLFFLFPSDNKLYIQHEVRSSYCSSKKQQCTFMTRSFPTGTNHGPSTIKSWGSTSKSTSDDLMGLTVMTFNFKFDDDFSAFDFQLSGMASMEFHHIRKTWKRLTLLNGP